MTTVGVPRARSDGADARAHQGRLPGAGRADEREQRRTAEHVQAGLDVALAPEETVGVVDVEGLQALVGACAPGGSGRPTGQQRRVLPQDRLLKGDDVGSGVDPEPGGQDAPQLVQGPQRLALLSRLVLRVGLQHPAVLTQRGRPHQRLDLGEHLGVTSRAQHRLHPQLLGLEPKLVRPTRLADRRLPLLEVGEGVAVPEAPALR